MQMNIQIDKECRTECVGRMDFPCPQRKSHPVGISLGPVICKHCLIPSL